MTYESAVDYIHSLLKFGVRPGLERVRELLFRLGNPEKNGRFVHVAGTNGKGSVCMMLSGVLRQAGYKTGLFISPYVTDFRERFQINGKMIPKEDFARLTEKIMPIVEEMATDNNSPTEFEAITAIAFCWFQEQNCDVTVLETGLGGLLDSTNVIDPPLVSVITSISMDHMNVLGNTLSEIAFQKCGIIKKNGITVSAPAQPPEALAIIMARAAQEENPLLMGTLSGVKILREDIRGSDVRVGSLILRIPFAGRHQIANAVTALETVTALRSRGLLIPDEHIVRGIESAKNSARIEILREKPLTILDGAHNADGIRALSEVLRRFLPNKRIITVMGMMEDKEYEAAVGMIAPLSAAFFAVTPENPRAMDAQILAEKAAGFCPDVRVFADILFALDAAAFLAGADGADGAVLICGSLYLAAQIKEARSGRTDDRQESYGNTIFGDA